MRPLPTLGVGVALFSGLEPLLAAEPGLVDVIEVEPLTLWLQPDPTASRFRIDPDALERIGRLPGRKLLHGIGFAPGGTLEPEASQLPPLLAMRAALDCPWVSEHLSFNRARGRDGVFTTGFLLVAGKDNLEFSKSKGWIKDYMIFSNVYARPNEPDLYLVTITESIVSGAEGEKRQQEYMAWRKKTIEQMQSESGNRAEHREVISDSLLQELKIRK